MEESLRDARYWSEEEGKGGRETEGWRVRVLVEKEGRAEGRVESEGVCDEGGRKGVKEGREGWRVRLRVCVFGEG